MQNDTLQLFESLKPLSKQYRSHYGNNQWTVNSPKLGRTIYLESDLEYDHWIACVESDPNITYFCEHPLKVHIKVSDVDVTTVFDMIVRKGSQDWEAREVKYLRHLQTDQRAIRQITAQRSWCDIHSVKYRVMTEREIRHNPLWLDNWKIIIGYLNTADRKAVQQYRDHVLQVIRATAGIQLKALHNALPTIRQQLIYAIVFDLIHRGECSAPLDVMPVDGQLIVKV